MKKLFYLYISLFRKSRYKPNLKRASKYGFSPDLGGKNGAILSMRMQVILDSFFARLGSAPIWGGKKGEFRDWTTTIGMLLILGTGNRERESGNKCTAATLLRIQNGGQNKRKGSKRNNLG